MSVTETCRDISELTPNAQKACNLFLEECKKQGLNVLITETYRSQERQNYLYSQGRTRKGSILTWTKKSRHTSRRAWDICKNLKGHEYTDTNFFIKCGEIARSLGITWGGDWSTPDRPHFEISENWKCNEIEELTSINDIVWELAHRKIISNSDLWLEKLEKDKDCYWLARKSLQYIRTHENGSKNNVQDLDKVSDILWEYEHRNIITEKSRWVWILNVDQNAYWLARKMLLYMRIWE